MAAIGALLLLFALYGVALAIIGYIASPAVLTLEEMAGGCRPERRTPSQPRRLESASAESFRPLRQSPTSAIHRRELPVPRVVTSCTPR
jgi:hypothetical protein